MQIHPDSFKLIVHESVADMQPYKTLIANGNAIISRKPIPEMLKDIETLNKVTKANP